MATNPRKNRQKKQAAMRKAQKRSLVEHIKTLPPEVEAKVEAAVDQLMDTVQGTEGQGVSSSTVRPTPVNVTVKVDTEQQKVEKRSKETELKVDKNLLKAVTELTKQFDISNKKEKRGVAGWLGSKVASVKNAFTLEGAAGMLGVRRDDGSLKGAILGSMMQRQEKKQEKAKFISNFGMFTEEGRKLSGDKLTAAGEKRYNALTKIKEQRDILEQKATAAKAFGGELSEEDTSRLDRLKNAEDFVKGIAKKKPVKTSTTPPKTTKEQLFEGGVEGMREGITSASPEEQQALRDMDPQMLRGIFRGSLEELIQISDDQLKELEKIAKSVPTEEDRLESKRMQTAGPIQERQAQKTNEERSGSGSFLSNIIDGIMNKIPGLGKATSIARGALSVGKTIIGGAVKGIGILGKGALSLGGKALGGIASGAAKGIGGLGKGGLGMAKGLLGKLGPIAMAGMAAYDGFQGYQNAAENLGIEGRDATTGEKMSSAAGSIASGLTFGLLDEKSASKGIASFFGAGPSAAKVATPVRVAQAAELAVQRETLRKMENEERKQEKAPPAVINNAPTAVVNNKTTNIQRIPVRNTEPTFNTRLRTHFA